MSGCVPLGISTPKTLSFPSARTHNAATMELSFPPLMPTTALQPLPFSSNHSLIQLTIKSIAILASNINILLK